MEEDTNMETSTTNITSIQNNTITNIISKNNNQDKEETNTQVSEEQNISTNKPNYRYTIADMGPFFIIARSKQNNINTIHPMKLGRWLYREDFSVVQMHKAGYNQLEIHFPSANQANRFLDSEFNTIFDTETFIPYYNIHVQGVIAGIDTDISETEIIKDTKVPEGYKITNVYRFQYRVTNSEGLTEYKPSTKVKLTFRAQNLPRYINLYFLRREIKQYNERIIQCRSCGRFNHKTKFCRSTPKCLRCGGTHDMTTCKTVPQCINCGQSHPASDITKCPTYKLETSILTTVSQLPVSKYQARQIVKGNKSYAEILQDQTTNKDNNKETEYPPLPINQSQTFNNISPTTITKNQRPKRKINNTKQNFDHKQWKENLIQIHPEQHKPTHIGNQETAEITVEFMGSDTKRSRSRRYTDNTPKYNKPSITNTTEEIIDKVNSLAKELPENLRHYLEEVKKALLVKQD